MWISMTKEMPEIGEVVDIYSLAHGRLTDYCYVRISRGNNAFVPTKCGVSFVRDATHWMIPTQPPEE